MLNAFLAVMLTLQGVPTDTVDVEQVMTALLTDSTQAGRSVIRVASARGRSVHIDLESSTRAFIQGLPAQWTVTPMNTVGAIEYRLADVETLSCPDATSLGPNCRVRGNDAWIGIDEVRRVDDDQISVRVHVLWTERSDDGSSRLAGFTTLRLMQRSNTGWRTSKVLATASG